MTDAVFWVSLVVVVSSTSLPSNMLNNHFFNSAFFPFVAALPFPKVFVLSHLWHLAKFDSVGLHAMSCLNSQFIKQLIISCLEIFCTRSLAFLLIWFGCLFALFALFNELVKLPNC
jgi:hypothetical protein